MPQETLDIISVNLWQMAASLLNLLLLFLIIKKFLYNRVKKMLQDRQNTIDGNLNTRWSAEGFGQYIIFDLGSVKDISAMGIAYYQGSKRSSYYDILVSEDGEEWTKLVSDAESSGKSDDLENFELVTKARYVKYYGYGNSQGKWNSLSEVAIYSK